MEINVSFNQGPSNSQTEPAYRSPRAPVQRSTTVRRDTSETPLLVFSASSQGRYSHLAKCFKTTSTADEA